MREDIKREIITTADGSKTIRLPELDEQYHSKHGAINEAKHVFIKNGLDHVLDKNNPSTVAILEIGFGTGLNAFITFLEAEKSNLVIDYVGVEAYPVSIKDAMVMRYPEALLAKDRESDFERMHQCMWEQPTRITPNFNITKRKQFFTDIIDQNQYDLIYFDAFGARVQPELWTSEIFEKMYEALRVKGILVTYAAKGSVRRAMLEIGFEVEKLPGPPGKREMLRATKN